MKPEKTNHERPRGKGKPGEFLIAAGAGVDPVSQHDSFEWLAFCYVADELTDSQRADFESRLATDLRAQEALAAAVELSSRIYRGYESSSKSLTRLNRAEAKHASRHLPSKVSRRLLLAAALLMMAFIGYGIIANSENRIARGPEDSPISQNSSTQLDLPITADDWIDSFHFTESETIDGDQLSNLAYLDSQENDQNPQTKDSFAGEDLILDASLISFYSDMLDSGQENKLLNPKSLRQKKGVEL